MSKMTKGVLREMITEDNFKTLGDLHSYLREIFKDDLQEMLATKLEIELGYSKDDGKNKNTDNS